MSTNVADYVLSRLRQWGVNHVFGFAGDGINGLLAAWERADDRPRFVQARHEEMAAFEACAEQVLLPALREADDDTLVLADGFSCRTQIHQLDSGGKEGRHLAQILAEAVTGGRRPHTPDHDHQPEGSIR